MPRNWTLRLWVAEVNAQLALAGADRCIALDGKTLRGAAKRGAQPTHLPAAVSHQLKTVWGEVPVDSKTNEITLVSELLNLLVVGGHLITAARPIRAVRTTRATGRLWPWGAPAYVDKGGEVCYYPASLPVCPRWGVGTKR